KPDRRDWAGARKGANRVAECGKYDRRDDEPSARLRQAFRPTARLLPRAPCNRRSLRIARPLSHRDERLLTPRPDATLANPTPATKPNRARRWRRDATDAWRQTEGRGPRSCLKAVERRRPAAWPPSLR